VLVGYGVTGKAVVGAVGTSVTITARGEDSRVGLVLGFVVERVEKESLLATLVLYQAKERVERDRQLPTQVLMHLPVLYQAKGRLERDRLLQSLRPTQDPRPSIARKLVHRPETVESQSLVLMQLPV
jgi:hypothetical protein